MVIHGVFAGQLEAGFIGFCAGIAEKHPLGECGVRQLSGQPQYRFVGHGIGNMPEFPGLFGQGLDKLRMAMPQGIDCDATGKIQIFPAILIPEPGPQPFDRNKSGGCVIRHHHFIKCGTRNSQRHLVFP